MKRRVLGARPKRLIFMVSSVILALLAIVQVMIIFIYPLDKENRKTGDTVSIDVSMLSPERIFMTLGGSKNEAFICLEDENEEMARVSEHASLLIGCSLEDAVWVKADEQAPEWDRLCCVLVFSCKQMGTTLEQYYHVNGVPELSFDQIYLYPSSKSKQDIKILFLDTEEQTWWQAFPSSRYGKSEEQRSWNENLALYEDILRSGTNPSGTKYLEAGQHFKGYAAGTFIPDAYAAQTMRKGVLSGGLLANGTISRPQAEDWVNGIFDSPGSVRRTENENSLIYSNEKITVKISDDGSLEYRETLTDSEKREALLPEAYQTAVTFMVKEMQLTDTDLQTVLDSYEREGDSYVFLFDYEVNGYRLAMSGYDDILPDGDHPVRVVVTGNKVREYQRLAIKPEMEEEYEIIGESWLDMIDRLAAEGVNVIGVPSLVYDCHDGCMTPSWEVTVNNGQTMETVMFPAE